MKHATLALLAVLGFATWAWAPALAADKGGEKKTRTTLTGLYNSGFQDSVRPLRAVFTATGESTFEVVFYFKFNGRDHQYKGVAEGSLTEGGLSGRVKNEAGSRLFTFRGEFEGKTLKGEHFEVSRGREVKTGTLTLKG